MKYYILAIFDNGLNRWCIEFGDYSRRTVEVEREDYRDQGYAARDLRILATEASQSSIDTAITRLNKSA